MPLSAWIGFISFGESWMRTEQLCNAADTIAAVLKKSDLLNSIRQHRDASDAGRNDGTHARLAQSAKILLRDAKDFSVAEKEVCSQLHLSSIGSLDYWQALLNKNGDQKAQQAELVQLFSRIMFASSHLPSLTGLLSSASSIPVSINTGSGENSMAVILKDAGERASDPDRIARAIDGIDMIYSASVSLSRKPAADLQLREISGHPEKHLVFVGDAEGISALQTVLGSLPVALEQFREYEEIDLSVVVRSIPIFDDLAKLAELGAFNIDELKNIDDTMYQGVMLALESGAVVGQAPTVANPDRNVRTLKKRPHHSEGEKQGFAKQAMDTYGYADRLSGADLEGHVPTPSGSGQQDEHYKYYLQERERLRRPAPVNEQKAQPTNMFRGFKNRDR